MIEYLLTGILFGITLTFVGAYLQREVSHRLNYGKKVIANRRHAGYVVTCRFNGSKKYYFVDNNMNLSTDYFYNKKDAIQACRETRNKKSPKQATFTRVA
jgi:hypothetical protein